MAQACDLIIVGGGVNGAATCRDASMRGLNTLLLERGDFASGASGHNGRMIHGGLRYLGNGDIGLVIGEPAQFRFFSSAVRKQDNPGTVLPSWSEDDLVETDSVEAVLPADESIDEPYVPVRFHTRITELGVFELWCFSPQTGGRWKLEFSVREQEEDESDLE